MSNSHLTTKQLNDLKDSLLKMKHKLESEVKEDCHDNQQDDSREELADFSNHPADLGTEQFEQERDQSIELMNKNKLNAINKALHKINKGTYGFSEQSGKPIPFERLKATPTATTLVEED